MPKKSPLHLIPRKLTGPEMNRLLKDAIEESNVVKKGKKFELFFENFMAQQRGFVFLQRHCRSEVGEIDYFYRSEHRDHPLFEKYPYVFIECKNWSDPVSSEKMDHFIRLMQAKTIFPCCGIYLTTSYFSPEAMTTMRDARREGTMIIPIEHRELPEMIEKGFKAFVQERCDKIIAKA